VQKWFCWNFKQKTTYHRQQNCGRFWCQAALTNNSG